jgi:hypothetical protein
MPDAACSKMTQKELLEIIQLGIVSVDLQTGNVIKNGHILKNFCFPGKNFDRPLVRIYHCAKLIRILVHQIVWIAGTGREIPPGFEIHHMDEDPTNNKFENLICVSRADHMKLHGMLIDDGSF